MQTGKRVIDLKKGDEILEMTIPLDMVYVLDKLD
jgi:hypothetical protein